jgi:acyl-CoA synthetase (NDP forming)
VAVVGASPPEKDSYATFMVQSFQDAGFPAIYPINPRYSEILGLPCYPDLVSVPGVVDHVVVCIPAEAALGLLDDCARKGVRSVHFFTAGFSESGSAERAGLEKAMLEKAKQGNFRIIGPNCVGLYVPGSRVTFWTKLPLEPGPIAFLSQSGGNAQDLPYLGEHRGLRFSKVVSYGNALDIGDCELLEYFTADPETAIIAAYIEGVKDGERFLKALKTATARKPVVIYKGGITRAGGRATKGHTASMTSSVDVFAVACRQCGAILVENMDELMDTLVTLRFMPLDSLGKGVVIMGGGGGPSVLASDELELAGLSVPQLAPDIQAELRKHLPLAGSIFSNPVDSNPLTVPDIVAKTVPVVLSQPDIDMVAYHLGFHPISRWGFRGFDSEKFIGPFIKAFQSAMKASGKQVFLVMRPAPDPRGYEEFVKVEQAFSKAGIPVYISMRGAARALARVLSWKQMHERRMAQAR